MLAPRNRQGLQPRWTAFRARVTTAGGTSLGIVIPGSRKAIFSWRTMPFDRPWRLDRQAGPARIRGSVDLAGLWPPVTLEDFHHQGRVVRENDARGARPPPIASHPPKNFTGRRLNGAAGSSPFATASTRGVPLPAAYGEKYSTSRAAKAVNPAMAPSVSGKPASGKPCARAIQA